MDVIYGILGIVVVVIAVFTLIVVISSVAVSSRVTRYEEENSKKGII